MYLYSIKAIIHYLYSIKAIIYIHTLMVLTVTFKWS